MEKLADCFAGTFGGVLDGPLHGLAMYSKKRSALVDDDDAHGANGFKGVAAYTNNEDDAAGSNCLGNFLGLPRSLFSPPLSFLLDPLHVDCSLKPRSGQVLELWCNPLQCLQLTQVDLVGFFLPSSISLFLSCGLGSHFLTTNGGFKSGYGKFFHMH